MAHAAPHKRPAAAAEARFQPREAANERRKNVAPQALAPSPLSRRILVVDDDECMRELVRLHLENAGYEVETAEDAVVALKSIMRRPPGLVILDVNLPYMNGLEFVSALKSDAGFRHVPVMFLTARTDVDDRAQQLGALACLKKPLLAPLLIAAVAAAVSGGRLAIG